MRLPIDWIKEYAPVEADAEEIAHRLTMAGLEVEETEESEAGPVLNIKVTPNRGDCLSVVGVARELAAAYRLEPPAPPAVEGVDAECGRRASVAVRQASMGEGEAPRYTSIVIEDADLCPRYAARIVRNVQNRPSPEWMQRRLLAAGMRPINGIVDVTNYVMLEMGQPLHAFDYDTLAENRIVVRRARPGETLRTLDGSEHALTPEMLAICDAHKPVALAGIMGGFDTEMRETTRTMLLEAAHFAPRSIRRTARALNMQTEASYRFERIVDPEGVVAAANRACALITELGLGEVVPGVIDIYPSPAPRRTLALRPARTAAMLGFDVTEAQIVDSLSRLGFVLVPPTPDAPEGGGRDVPRTSDQRPVPSLTFAVPSWRPDIVREIDLIEEVGRVVGYENIPERLPLGATTQGGDTDLARFAERVREILVGAGLEEIVGHSLLAPSPYEDPRTADQRIAIRSALSAELSGLRRSLLPSLFEALERNGRRGFTRMALFEIGRVFARRADGYSETMAVGGVLVGPLAPVFWDRGAGPGASDFYTGRGLIERLAEALRLGPLEFLPGDDPRLHPGRQADIRCAGRSLGFVGELHPDLRPDLKIRDRYIVFELSLEALREAAQGETRRLELSPFPTVVRDLAPRLAEAVPYRQVQEAIERAGIEFLERYDLTDIYRGANLPEGVKALTLSFTFRRADRTLTEAEVNEAIGRLRAALESRCGAAFVG